MSAGNIILADGTTITPEDLQKIAAETKKLLASESKELSQFEEAASLEELTSLPGISQSGTSMKLVRVAMSLLKGVDGKTVELSASETAIQWRYVGESEWKTLVDLSLLKGDKGDPGEKIVLRKGESGIEWKYEKQEDIEYQPLVSIDDIKLKFTDLSEEDKAELTKIPILSTVNAQSGTTSSGSFSSDGRDGDGNPKYILNLTLQKGEKGEYPIIEVGNVITGLPSSEVSVDLSPNGETPEGNPKYLLNLSIPKGEPGQNGDGSGNVFVQETGLVAGKQYLFRPSAPNSASGTLVEYVAPDTSQFITSAVNNLVNYYLKSETYTKEEVTQLLGQLTTINFKVVDVLPESGESNLIYLLKKEGEANDVHDEYIWVEGKWEIIGSTAVDLTNYYTKEDSDRRFALKTEIPEAITKEAIEAVFTGNIESHSHDTVYEDIPFETDVWDGVTVADSVQGTGTRDYPYIINSCAEWIHFWNNSDSYALSAPSSSPSEMGVFVKLNKSLDFNNQKVSYIQQSNTYLCDVDGCGATISNFIIDECDEDNGNTYGIANTPNICYFHNFNLVGIHFRFNLTLNKGGGAYAFPLDAFSSGVLGFMYNAENNIYIKSNISLTGTADKTVNIMNMIAGFGSYLVGSEELLNNIFKDDSIHFGSEVTLENNMELVNESKLIVSNSVISGFGDIKIGISGFDNSESSVTGVYSDDYGGGFIFEGNSCLVLGIISTETNIDVYINREKASGYVIQDGISFPTFVDDKLKTGDELNSDSFINTILNKNKNVFIKGTTTPVVKQTVPVVTYEGYISKKEFNSFIQSSGILNKSHNVVVSLSNLNPSRRFVIAEIGEDQELSLKPGMKDGDQLSIIIKNTSGSIITITLPTSSEYINMTSDSLKIEGYKYGEINILYDGKYYYTRAV